MGTRTLRRVSVLLVVVMTCALILGIFAAQPAYAKTTKKPKPTPTPKFYVKKSETNNKVVGGAYGVFPYFGLAPVIDNDATTATAMSKNMIELRTEASISDNTPLRYHWYVKLPGEDSFEPILGALGSIYYHRNVTKGETYSYFVEVFNDLGFGVRSNVVTVTAK